MTRAQFRAAADSTIQQHTSLFGVYFADHADGSLYLVTQWVNCWAIACDEYWRPGEMNYHEEYLRAMQSVDTRHWPQADQPVAE